MANAELGKLVESHRGPLGALTKGLATGDTAGTVAAAATLVTALATGHPEVAILAPFAEQTVAHAFGRSVNATLRRELAAMDAEEAKRALAESIAEPIEVLIGQALIQLVRAQHRVKEELVDELGGLRADLAGFRDEFTRELGGAAMTIAEQIVQGGAIGVRVRESSRRRVYIAQQTVSGQGSVGVDLC